MARLAAKRATPTALAWYEPAAWRPAPPTGTPALQRRRAGFPTTADARARQRTRPAELAATTPSLRKPSLKNGGTLSTSNRPWHCELRKTSRRPPRATWKQAQHAVFRDTTTQRWLRYPARNTGAAPAASPPAAGATRAGGCGAPGATGATASQMPGSGSAPRLKAGMRPRRFARDCETSAHATPALSTQGTMHEISSKDLRCAESAVLPHLPQP